MEARVQRYKEILREARTLEERGVKWWRYHDVKAHPGYLTNLVALGFLNLKKRARRHKYCLTEKGRTADLQQLDL